MTSQTFGGAGQNIGPFLNINIPFANVRGSAMQLGLWTAATSTALSANFAGTPVALSIHSAVATVYGAVGTGTLSVTMQKQLLPSPGKVNMASFTVAANTLVPQVFGAYAKGSQAIPQATASPTVVFFVIGTSTTWTQSSGGIWLTINAYH